MSQKEDYVPNSKVALVDIWKAYEAGSDQSKDMACLDRPTPNPGKIKLLKKSGQKHETGWIGE